MKNEIIEILERLRFGSAFLIRSKPKAEIERRTNECFLKLRPGEARNRMKGQRTKGIGKRVGCMGDF
jgi:hypothetical protein